MPTSYRLDPATTTYPGSTTYPGVVTTETFLHAFIDLSGSPTGTPNWSELTSTVTRVRAFSINRGRESELSQFDAGTATLVVNNRDRAFDPTNASSPYYPYIRPMTRFLLQVEFAGTIYDMFKGYAESFQQQWPDGGWSDSIVNIPLVDEFKVLSLALMPTTSPPRDTYTDLVIFDNPLAYWRMNDPSFGLVESAVIGPQLRSTSLGGGSSLGTPFAGAIVGDRPDPYGSAQVPTGFYMTTDDLGPFETPDVGGLSEFAFDVWFKAGAVSFGTSYQRILCGPETTDGGGVRQWELNLNNGGQLQFNIRDATPSTRVVTGSNLISANTWYHIAGSMHGGNMYLYLNGVQIGTTTTLSNVQGNGFFAGTADFFIGDPSSVINMYFDELAVYRYGLGADRIAAHYTGGTARGFPQQASGARISAALDAAGSTAARVIGTGARSVVPDFMRGRPPLDAIRDAVTAEAVDAVFFVNKSGAVTYLDSAHRSSAPYSTVQATFDDDGTDTSYLDMTTDYSDAFLANEWNVTRDGGQTQTVSDSTSIGKYFKQPQSLSGLPLVADSDAAAVATAMLAKYKEPMERITSISFNNVDATIAAVVFQRDLCDKIRVLRTTPGGGRLDQSVWIQKIEIAGDNSGAPWSIRWAVSPL